MAVRGHAHRSWSICNSKGLQCTSTSKSFKDNKKAYWYYWWGHVKQFQILKILLLFSDWLIPLQVHLTQGDYDGKAMIISWVTPDEPGPSRVKYGTSKSKLQTSKEGTVSNYTFYNYKSGYIHHCLIEGLKVIVRSNYHHSHYTMSKLECARLVNSTISHFSIILNTTIELEVAILLEIFRSKHLPQLGQTLPTNLGSLVSCLFLHMHMYIILNFVALMNEKLQVIWGKRLIHFQPLSIIWRVEERPCYMLEIFLILMSMSSKMLVYGGIHGGDLQKKVQHINHGFGM